MSGNGAARVMALGTLAWVAGTFVVQGLSHFAINREHYAGIAFLRAEPVFVLGLLATVMQGLVLSWLYVLLRAGGRAPGALRYAWVMGLLLASYWVLAEPGKYAVPSVGAWIGVESAAAFVQFTLFGLVLGWIVRPARAGMPAGAPSPS